MSQISTVLRRHHEEIIRYEEMCQAIQACHAVDEVKEIRDRAMALEVYAAQALNMDAERKACEIRLRAERRAGELLKEMGRNGQRAKPGDKGPTDGKGARPSVDVRTLSDLGISKDQSSKWQQLADVPESEFEAALADPATKPSTERFIKKDAPTVPKMNPMSLWIWGRMREFESQGFSVLVARELFSAMTETMQSDVKRIAPQMIEFFKEIA